MQERGEGEAMQVTRERRVTTDAVRIISALAVAAFIGAGCGKTETVEPPAPEVPVAVETDSLSPELPLAVVPPVESETWEPETVTPPNAADHGHEGHDHGPGGHTH
jgi:hypothetical protein